MSSINTAQTLSFPLYLLHIESIQCLTSVELPLCSLKSMMCAHMTHINLESLASPIKTLIMQTSMVMSLLFFFFLQRNLSLTKARLLFRATVTVSCSKYVYFV